MISRALSERITETLKWFPALVLTGGRQTGKTTLLRNLFPQYTYITLDLPNVAAQAEENPEQFFLSNPPPLIVDEVQYAPSLFRYLKVLIDQDRHSMGKFILTGSQKFLLMKNISESLAGRVGLLELEGLSLKEVRSAGLNSDTLDFLWRGGFPELSRVPDLPKDIFFASYVATYLERDVRQILNVGNLRDFDRFLRLLATRNAQQLDLTSLGNAVGISTKTAGAWISVLESSGVISLLEPWYGNLGKRIVKTPKVYFHDTGLVTWLLGIESSQWRSGPFLGSLWETFVYSELRKARAIQDNDQKIYFYRDNQGLEVDFLIPSPQPMAVEVKAKSQIIGEDLKNLVRFRKLCDEGKDQLLSGLKLQCICLTETTYSLPLEDGALVEVRGI